MIDDMIKEEIEAYLKDPVDYLTNYALKLLTDTTVNNSRRDTGALILTILQTIKPPRKK